MDIISHCAIWSQVCQTIKVLVDIGIVWSPEGTNSQAQIKIYKEMSGNYTPCPLKVNTSSFFYLYKILVNNISFQATSSSRAVFQF